MNTIFYTSGQEFLALVKESLAASTSLPPPFRFGNQLAFILFLTGLITYIASPESDA